MLCLNLCEIFSPHLFRSIDPDVFIDYISNSKRAPVQRVYLGSSFCSQYFLLAEFEPLLELCARKRIPVTLTIPVFSEKDLDQGKQKIGRICRAASGIIDEITVNDLGMLSFVHGLQQFRINLGRLFFKDARDCRVPDHGARSVQPMLLSHLADSYWSRYHVHTVELDATNRIVDTVALAYTDIQVGLHLPYCYMTTGNICKFASIHWPVDKKFRPNVRCGMECTHIHDIYSGYVPQTECSPVLHRVGRTLYFEADHTAVTGKPTSRVIYFPINELRKFADENIGSVK